MDAVNFVYWLNGFVELAGTTPTEEQWTEIKNHLKLTMNKVTPTLQSISFQPLFMEPSTEVPYKSPDFRVICNTESELTC